jgi:hypothetical protein
MAIEEILATDEGFILKIGLVFLILFLVIGINLPVGMITHLGFSEDYLTSALVAVTLTGLIAHQRLFLIILVLICSIAANLPEEMLNAWGFNRDYFIYILAIMVVVPISVKLYKFRDRT